MPRGDRTGPMGMGPRTGRVAGYCGGRNAEGCVRSAMLGSVRNQGGRGRRNMFYATGLTGRQLAATADQDAIAAPTAEAEKQFLKSEVGAMQSQLEAMEKRLAKLEVQNG
jgi:hypothetical protein